jgi:hypothetical protein
VTLYLRAFCVNNPVGSRIGISSRTTLGGKLVTYSQPQSSLAIDCTAAYKVAGLTVAKGKTYTVKVEANTKNGEFLDRTITIVGV